MKKIGTENMKARYSFSSAEALEDSDLQQPESKSEPAEEDEEEYPWLSDITANSHTN